MKRETVWPAMLIIAVFLWALHYSLTLPPPFGQRWLLILCTLTMFISVSVRIWRGRYPA